MSGHPDNPTGSAGTVMLGLFWLVVMGALAWGFSDYLDHRDNPNQNIEGTSTAQYREVTLNSARYGHYVASGYINGVPVTFLVDTGASLVAIPAALEKKLGLRRGAQGISSTAGGNVASWSTTLDSVRIGNIELTDVRGSINPSMKFDEVLLGMSFLREMELTQKENTLTIRQWR